jgi:hypothetical protein
VRVRGARSESRTSAGAIPSQTLLAICFLHGFGSTATWIHSDTTPALDPDGADKLWQFAPGKDPKSGAFKLDGKRGDPLRLFRHHAGVRLPEVVEMECAASFDYFDRHESRDRVGPQTTPAHLRMPSVATHSPWRRAGEKCSNRTATTSRTATGSALMRPSCHSSSCSARIHPDETDNSSSIGEDADDRGPALDLLVEPLKRVGAPDLTAVGLGEREVREQVGLGIEKELRDRRESRLEALGDVTEGTEIGSDRVARLMSGLGLSVRTTKAADQSARPADVVERTFAAPAPNRLWVADLTYYGRPTSPVKSGLGSRSGRPKPVSMRRL